MNYTDLLLILFFNLLSMASGYMICVFTSRSAFATLRTDLYTATWIARHLINEYRETGHITPEIINRHLKVIQEIENQNTTDTPQS